MTAAGDRYDVVVVGGGQAGRALGYFLARDGRRFTVRAGHDGGFVVEPRDRAYAADQVVIAAGPFQTARVPALAEQLDASLVQMHSTDYRGPADVPGGPFSWWAAATPATRSPRSSRRPTRCTSPSARGSPRCRSGCSAAMSSVTSKRAASCA